MKDYKVTVKVRNNRILKAIEEAGGAVGSKWCLKHGLYYVGVNNLINMTSSPIHKNGELTELASKLCEVLNKSPFDLWSEEQLVPLEKNTSEFEMSGEQVQQLLSHEPDYYLQNFDENLDLQDLRKTLEKAFEKLTPREKQILQERFYKERTLSEIGADYDVTKERIREIEAKALRKLRHPSAANELRDFL